MFPKLMVEGRGWGWVIGDAGVMGSVRGDGGGER